MLQPGAQAVGRSGCGGEERLWWGGVAVVERNGYSRELLPAQDNTNHFLLSPFQPE